MIVVFTQRRQAAKKLLGVFAAWREKHGGTR
jgi:hypothetical protein